MYPGIPGDFREWPHYEKEAWIANYPQALAHVEAEADLQDTNTTTGLRRRVFELTSSHETAEKIANEVELAKLQRAKELESKNNA